MKTKVGVVGPETSVDIIMAIGAEFLQQLELIRYDYSSVSEVRNIVQNNLSDIDMWLFSGQIPYLQANNIAPLNNSLFLPVNSSSLAKILLQIYANESRILSKFSIDCITEEDLHETVLDCELNDECMRTLPFSAENRLEDYIQFHGDLYRAGEVDACITSITLVYQALQDLGVPVYRMFPTRYSIRQLMTIICHHGETLQFKRSQIAIHVIQVEGFDSMAGNRATYRLHRVDLKLREIILSYTEELLGSFVYLGNGMFIIFSNRGSIDDRYDRAVTLQSQIRQSTNLDSNIGIGYGTTSLFAEKNAYLALSHARQQLHPSTMLVDDHGSISGPLQTPESLSYRFRTTDREIAKKLQDAGINITTFAKLAALQENVDEGALTANIVSNILGMTPRNARRILNLLERYELATTIGHEALSDKGRPSKLYRVQTNLGMGGS